MPRLPSQWRLRLLGGVTVSAILGFLLLAFSLYHFARKPLEDSSKLQARGSKQRCVEIAANFLAACSYGFFGLGRA